MSCTLRLANGDSLGLGGGRDGLSVFCTFLFVSINISFLHKADIDYTERTNEMWARLCGPVQSKLAEEDTVPVYP